MRNILLVIRHEIIVTLSKRSYWIMTFLFPLVIILINVGTQVITRNAIAENEKYIPEKAGKPIGYVDAAGLVKNLPPDVPAGMLIAFPDQKAAQLALEAGDLQSYAFIPADYVETGNYLLVQREYKPADTSLDSLFKYILTYNLTGSADLTNAITNPLANVTIRALAPVTASTGSLTASLVPFATLFIFFFLLTNSSSLMLSSVAGEKENRTVEVLLLSLRPRELMLGKVLGLCVVAMLQMVLWFGGGLLILNQAQSLLSSASRLNLPPNFIPIAILYFLMGYLMYASMMGAVGALAPNLKESGQFTIVVLVPLMLPVLFNTVFVQTPNSLVAVAMSLFPLTAPTAMVTRLVSVNVPLWQLAVSLGGLAVSSYLLVLLSARFFQAGTLLSNESLNWKRIAGVFSSKEEDQNHTA